jgi:hypothetical protein
MIELQLQRYFMHVAMDAGSITRENFNARFTGARLAWRGWGLGRPAVEVTLMVVIMTQVEACILGHEAGAAE